VNAATRLDCRPSAWVSRAADLARRGGKALSSLHRNAGRSSAKGGDAVAHSLRRLAACCSLLVLLTGVVPGQKREYFPPVDEASQEPSLLAFRDGFKSAIHAHDVEAVLSSATPDLIYGLAESRLSGRADFASDLRANRFLQYSGRDDIWRRLANAVERGGAFSTTHGAVQGRREFCTPYYYGKLPSMNVMPPHLDNEGAAPVVITGRDVAVRENFDGTSRVIARLSHELVRFGGPITEEAVSVELANGASGVVDRRYAGVVGRDYHACFARIDGDWRLTAFAPGAPHGVPVPDPKR
jgi:hypothetical protein